MVHLCVGLPGPVPTAVSHAGPAVYDDTAHLLLLRLRCQVTHNLHLLLHLLHRNNVSSVAANDDIKDHFVFIRSRMQFFVKPSMYIHT